MNRTIHSIGILAAVLAIAAIACGCKDGGQTGQQQGQPAAAAKEAAPAGKPQTACPVMGGKIDKSIYVDYQGKRVYLCCESCLAEAKKDPEKYIKKLEAEGVVLEKAPAAEK
jgi:YHS domain-containing protein